ncbi:MAG: MFS transporter [Anaerolineae bacterium]|nr:MFS transporter [Thermoflexales bacterium]MDW8406181.1 MFS transporter [Anaerolineae bacterium]
MQSSPSAPSAATEKVPFLTKLAFGAGDVGPAVATAIMSFFLLYFLTDVARLNPAAAGLILLLNKIWDSVNDPLVGMVSDRLRTRWGRRRPWFLFGAIPFGLTFLLLFLVPPFDDTGKFAYYLVVSLMLDLAFTVVNVPYTALTAELTRDYDERTSLNQYRFAFSIGSGLIAAVAHPIIVNAVQPAAGVQTAYAVSALVWAVVATVPFFFAFWGTYERHTVEEEAPMPILQALRFTFANRAFRYVTAIYLASWLVVQTVSTIVVYYLTYWLRQPELTAPVILAVQGSALIWLFIWTRVSRRVGKKGVYFRGMGFWIAVSFALFVVQPDWPAWTIILLGALAGVGVATAYLVPWAMLPDVIELDELQTGRRREGAFYGFFVLLQKLGLAVGLFLVSQVLAWSGYITPPANATTPIVQPDSALLAIRWMIGPAPAIVLLIGMGLVWRFPITKAQHEQTLAELQKRRGQLA